MTTRLRVVGFVSTRSAHAHVLKHVLRVTEQSHDQLRRADDPERWSDLVADPPLATEPLARRRRALAALEPIAHCGVREVTSDAPCDRCWHEGALRAADAALGPVLESYLEVAQAALAWSFTHRSRKGPRALAYFDGRATVISVVTEKGVKLVGELDTATGEVRARTCFRMRGRDRSFSRNSLELERERAGHLRAGTHVSLEPYGVRDVDA